MVVAWFQISRSSSKDNHTINKENKQNHMGFMPSHHQKPENTATIKFPISRGKILPQIAATVHLPALQAAGRVNGRGEAEKQRGTEGPEEAQHASRKWTVKVKILSTGWNFMAHSPGYVVRASKCAGIRRAASEKQCFWRRIRYGRGSDPSWRHGSKEKGGNKKGKFRD